VKLSNGALEAEQAGFLLSQVAQLRKSCVYSHWLGLVNGKPWEPVILTPTESTYLNRSLKSLSQVITSTTSTAVQNLVEIRSWGTSGQIGEILTIFRFLFIPFFKQRTYRSDRSQHFHA